MKHTIKHSITAFVLLVLIFMVTSLVLADEGEPPLTIDQLTAEQVSKSQEHTQIAGKLNEGGVVRLIVKLETPANFTGVSGLNDNNTIDQMAMIDSAQAQFIAEHPNFSEDVVTFEFIPYASIWVDNESEYAALLADGNVLSVEQDIPVPTNEVEAAPKNMAQAIPWVDADFAHSLGYDGTGYTVAILDTGVDKDHDYLDGGKVVSEACYSTNGTGTAPDESTFTSYNICPGGSDSTATNSAEPYGGSCPNFECDHGTHVAGIAAGTGTGFSGVAPDADIIAIQVFSGFISSYYCGSSDCTLSFTTDQVLGLERVYALRNTYDIAAVNMSLGGDRYFSYCASDPRVAIINSLASAGIATVISSGNNGFTDSVGAPGCVETAYTIGATEDNSDTVAWFSNADSTILDMWAPGVSITSAVPTESYAGTAPTDTWNGTSMAAPMVTGAFAVMREAYPTETLNQIWTRMANAGVSVTDSRTILFPTTAPRLDFTTAVSASLTAPDPRFPKNNYVITSGTSNFKWTAVTGATSYHMELYRPNNNRLDIWEVDSSHCDAEFCNFMIPYKLEREYGFYDWRVRALTSSDTGDWSPSVTFEYVALDSISGISPPEGSSTSDTTPTLTWEDATEGVYVYNIQVWKLDGTAVINTTQNAGTVCSGGTCTWTVSPALSPDTYKWRVLGKKWPNVTPWTDAIVFTVTN